MGIWKITTKVSGIFVVINELFEPIQERVIAN